MSTVAATATISPLRRRTGALARRALVATVRTATADARAWPDLVVIGAQRSGTTSLWRWLQRHDAFVPPVLGMKGVHYFDLARDRPLRWYRAHFPLRRTLARRGNGHTGEASPYYLFHPRVPTDIATALPSARFVALLRDPVARAVSHYHHMRDEGTEPLPTLEAALDAEDERLRGADERLLADPAAVDLHHMHHSYVARGHYAEQLVRWFTAVGRERVLVLDAARLRTEPGAVLAEVCAHAGLDPSGAVPTDGGANAGRYDPPAAATVTRLRAHFAPHDEHLWDLLGERWW